MNQLFRPAFYLGALLVGMQLLPGCQEGHRSDANEASLASTSVSAAASSDLVETGGRPEGWDAYWYNGQAEVNSYSVQQERYGEDRPSKAVLVFVTEPFLPETQVKDDGQPRGKEASISVFKLNRVEHFTTGIYDYSLMLSVFTPVSLDQYPYTLKSTFSSQDWCGQVWQQANRRGKAFQVQTRSYFQGEGDEEQTLAAEYLEDELVSRVRLDPTAVPTGEVSLVPAAKFSRLRHVQPSAERAQVSLEARDDVLELTIDFGKLDRQVSYRFDSVFPHQLQGWTETYQGKRLSEAKLEKSIRAAYWGQNAGRFDAMRDTLKL